MYWSAVDSRHLIQANWSAWNELLVWSCQNLVTVDEIGDKEILSRGVREISRTLERLSTRYVDLRGRDVYLGRITARSPRDEPLGLDEALWRVGQVDAGGAHPRWPGDAVLRICDTDTGHVLSDAQASARRLRDLLGNLRSVPTASQRTWTLPTRPGRPRGIEIREVADHGTPGSDPPRFVHGTMFSIELCAAELCAASVALHALEVPTALLVDLGKQIFDEIRHFRMLETLLRRYDAKVGDYPVDTLIWDKFLLGESLAERLVIEQRLGEGNGLDGGFSQFLKYRGSGDAQAAQVFDFINADEMTHVRNGNRWIAELAGGWDKVAALDERMRRRLAEHDWPMVHREPINSADRLLSGFTRDEVAAVRRQAQASAGER